MKSLLTHLVQVALGIALLFLFAGQKIYAASQSHKLETMVEKTIDHYYFEPFNVAVADSGVVTIRGVVPVLYDRLHIYDIIAQVKGVRKIKDEIVVNAPIIADKMIEASLDEKFAVFSGSSEKRRIKVRVDNGVVFLKGEVNSYREKLMANTVVSWEKGVKGIENEIQVASTTAKKTDEDLSAELQEILSHRFPHEKNVMVSVHNGVATLSGATNTLWSEDQIVKGMSGVIGVQKVVSSLKLAE